MIQIDGIIKNAVIAHPKNAVFCEVKNGELVFFTLTEVGIHTPFDNEGQLNEEEFVEEETIHGLGEEPFQFDSSGNIIAKFSNFVKNEIGRGEDGHSKAQAAAYHSSTKETFSHDTQAGHSDPVDDINGSLSQFGSTTLNHLLSETMGNVDTENNQCGETLEAEREITADVENAIVESIATSEDREQFINEISDIYKDHYFKKESLGGLYDFLLHLMGSKKALKRSNLKIKDIHIVELNEAFASQSIACIRDLEIEQKKVNLDGGAIALGHPLGATGARITGKAADLLLSLIHI